MFVHKPFKICGAPEQLGLRYQCEWLTEVAQSKTVNPETVQWAPRSAAICFVPAAESVKSETLEKVDKSSWPQL